MRVIDPFTIKLALSQAAATVAPATFGESAVDDAGDFLTLAGFADGQAVTYRAPATIYFQTEGIDAALRHDPARPRRPGPRPARPAAG